MRPTQPAIWESCWRESTGRRRCMPVPTSPPPTKSVRDCDLQYPSPHLRVNKQILGQRRSGMSGGSNSSRSKSARAGAAGDQAGMLCEQNAPFLNLCDDVPVVPSRLAGGHSLPQRWASAPALQHQPACRTTKGVFEEEQQNPSIDPSPGERSAKCTSIQGLFCSSKWS